LASVLLASPALGQILTPSTSGTTDSTVWVVCPPNGTLSNEIESALLGQLYCAP
jgi:hypothetical protein